MKTDPVQLAMIVALGFGAFWIFRKFKTGTLNPASRENIIYKATGEVGLKVADVFPSAAEKRVAEMLKVTPTIKAGSGYLVPASVYSTTGTKKAATPVPYVDFLPLYGMGRWIE